MQSIPDHRLMIEGPDIYSIFQASVPRNQSVLTPGIQYYTYARMIGAGCKLIRTDRENQLIPASQGKFDVEIHKNILMLPLDEVDAALDKIGVCNRSRSQPTSGLVAESVYQLVAGKEIGGVVLEACGTYCVRDNSVVLVIVDETGGYSIGESVLIEDVVTLPVAPLGNYVGAEHWTA